MNVLVLMELTKITNLLNPTEGINIIFIPIVYSVICLINYLILIKDNNSKTIIESFDSKISNLRFINYIPLIVYLLTSVYLLLIFWIQ